MSESRFDDELEIDVSRATRSLWRERWLLGVLFLLAVGLGVATTFFTRDTVYESQTTLFVEPFDRESVEPTSLEFYESIMRSDWVKQRVARRLGMLSAFALDSALTVESTRQSNLIRIKVRADSPEEAVDLLTVWTDVFVERLRAFQGQRVDTANEVLSRQIELALQSITEVQDAFARLRTDIGDRPRAPGPDGEGASGAFATADAAGADGGTASVAGGATERIVTERVEAAVSVAEERLDGLSERLSHLDGVLREQRTTVYPLGEEILDEDAL